MADVSYVTREDVKAALDIKETARANSRIDRAMYAASRTAESVLHRVFYPVVATRYFNFPNRQRSGNGRIWLDENELLTVTSLVSGGVTIPPANYFLEPNASGPPYDRIELNTAQTSSFGGGSTNQRDIGITGTYCGCPIDESAAVSVSGAVLAADTTITTGPGATGVGSLIRIDSERLIVTGKSSVSTGQTLAVALEVKQGATLVTVQDGTKVAVGETILIDAEYMLVTDVAGNNLIVQRAWDGSTLAAHTIGATVYAPRKLSVARGQLGTTAANHADASTIYRFLFPAALRKYVVALALDTVEQEPTGYARTVGAEDNARAASGRGLKDARADAVTALGRRVRTAAV